MKHLLFFLTLVVAVPAMATEENDTTIYYNNKQIVVSTDTCGCIQQGRQRTCQEPGD